jgi:hypothetical protein
MNKLIPVLIIFCTCGALLPSWAQAASPSQDAYVAELGRQLESAHPGVYDINSLELYRSIPWAEVMCALREMHYSPEESQAWVEGALVASGKEYSPEVTIYLNVIYQATTKICPVEGA